MTDSRTTSPTDPMPGEELSCFEGNTAVPPRAKSKNRRMGWVASTIREILRNEAYIGVWTYKKKQWRKVPGTNKRRYRRRPAEEILKDNRPHLRIIDQELWDAVAARRLSVASKHTGKSKSGTCAKRTNYPFSGLLYCGLCGGPMIILGGGSARYYRCGDATKRGTCSNRLGVREDVVVDAAIVELKRVLSHPDLIEKMRRRAVERIAQLERAKDIETVKIQRELDRVELEIERRLAFMQTTDASTGERLLGGLRRSLDASLGEQEALRRRLDAARARAGGPVRLPTPDEIVAGVVNIEEQLRADPIRAREALRAVLLDGRIVLEPQPDGSYRAQSVLTPLRLTKRSGTRKPRERVASGASGAGTERSVSSVGCAGRI